MSDKGSIENKEDFLDITVVYEYPASCLKIHEKNLHML